ncbi:UPF0182 family protein [Candidatus Nitrosotenuis uzonensis]|uniref:Uncharacterized protein n=1 Tax=Candidatus Nitrosotenuis uzonensis TaxID=1407055 RepID=V6AVB8_9ARCH|nr:UPF0182 family protein [Candidatus Nitrosotenuis uzonensis]CDI06550.1 conserved membrane hypothetical protein [Candidatus Nitrosotenuis uzonensis]
MYSSSTESNAPQPDAGRYIRLGIIAAIGIIVLVIVGNQGVILAMNMAEFGEQFTKPLHYSIISALVLSAIALINVDVKNRSSIFWYAVHVAITFLNRTTHDPVSRNISNFRDYRLSVPQFVIWQITKIFLFGVFFVNIMFGLAIAYLMDGNDLGVENLPQIFTLPFVTPQTINATDAVIPLIPALTILIPPILAVIGVRLAIYVGLHSIVKVITSYISDSMQGKPKFLNYVSTIEGVIGIGIVWAGINMFFTPQIDYNTKYAIGGTLAAGFVLIAFSIFDKFRSKVLTHPIKRDIYVRVFALIAIAIIAGSIMAVNNSIADARKIEFLGPYTKQQIDVNRYLGELDKIKITTNDVKLTSVSPNNIRSYISQNNDVLNSVRIWDWEAAFAKMKPEIGLIPYLDFEDNDILRFNNTLYWTASMKPVLPPTVSLENRWYNEHLVYTHVPNGFLTLDATTGQSVESSRLFSQRTIYYGEGGLFADNWSAYPTNRGDVSAELNNAFYAGRGGITVSPPTSYVFEPNFLLSFPADSVHVMRYKDVYSRMSTLYPYFLYNLFGQQLDFFPVTDGQNTYWLMPLIVGFDTHAVPWSMGNPYLRLIGFALIDTYHGDITLIKYGDDYFANIIESQYGDKFHPMPAWLSDQLRYPQELFTWKTEMFNIYHVTDTEKFIQASEFYVIPTNLEAYYINAKPPGFDSVKFLGLLSLEQRGGQGRNLSGYMIVENDLATFGNMQFYEVPRDSATKLIGPTAVREALDKDSEFAQLKTLLRTPRIGDNILYQVGQHDVYFIPVYTAGSGGGVVAQLGTIAAVGAAFNGEYYVGLGNTPQEAFETYLRELAGVVSPSSQQAEVGFNKDERIKTVRTIFEERGLEIVTPTSLQVPLSFKEGDVSLFSRADMDTTNELLNKFISEHVTAGTKRVLLWQDEEAINLGVIKTVDGIPELHYITIDVGK